MFIGTDENTVYSRAYNYTQVYNRNVLFLKSNNRLIQSDNGTTSTSGVSNIMTFYN